MDALRKRPIWLGRQMYNVLVVDDHPPTLDVIVNSLESFLDDDVKIYQTGTYKEALELVQKIDLDLAIVDYKLLNGSGIDLTAEIKRQNSWLPVLMITGHADIVKEAALEAGVNVFLSKPLEITEFLTLSKNLLSLSKTRKNLVSAEDMIIALNRAVEARDKYTEGHSTRVGQYSLQIFDNVKIENGENRNALYVGCLLHDIGKIGIPDRILKSRKSPLNIKEYDLVKQHTIKGYEICKDLTNLKAVLPVIRHHHERLDGSGYPDHLSKAETPLIAQIAAVADIYDALTTDRSYRQKNKPEEAFEIMEGEVKKGYLNKEYFDALKKAIEE